jgi:hypothetical protein
MALAAAVMHAGWNLLVVEQGGADRFLLWGQFAMAAVLCIPPIFQYRTLVPTRSVKSRFVDQSASDKGSQLMWTSSSVHVQIPNPSDSLICKRWP